MAKYSDIKGFTVQTLSTDTVASQAAGGTWSSGGSINEARYAMGGAGLTPSAAIVFGGSPSPGSPTLSSKTESYNGSTWTEVGDMPANRAFNAGVGTSTAAVSFGGTAPGAQDSVYEFDGTNWSSNPNAYPASYYSMAAAGTATAAIISGGNPAQTVVNTFDGTSFTSSTAMNTGRRGHGSVGTTTANLVSCGETPRTANTELWNGSSWTEVNDYPTATQDLSMWGTSTSAIGALGYDTANTANSASWDGTSWTETADLSNARNGAQTGGIGSDNTEGLVAGGDNSGRKDFTEEWGFPPVTSVVLKEGMIFLSAGSALKGFGKAAGIPSATWASGGSLNTARSSLAGSTRGSQTSSIAFGGYSGTAWLAINENYNGTSWTEVADLNTARGINSGAGTATAALTQGGYNGSTSVANTESWNGSAWTEVNDLNTGRRNAGGFGTQTSAAIAGGNLPPSTVYNQAESWDGTSWTEVSELNTARYGIASLGTGSDGLLTGGETSLGTPSITGKTEKWDGSSWTETGDLNQVRYDWQGGGGETSGGIVFGGYTGTAIAANTEFFNGSSWTELNDLSESVYANTGMGSAVAALNVGGNAPPHTSAVEEWTADAALSTVTVS